MHALVYDVMDQVTPSPWQAAQLKRPSDVLWTWTDTQISTMVQSNSGYFFKE